MSVFSHTPLYQKRKYFCLYQPAQVPAEKANHHRGVQRGDTRVHPEPPQRDGNDYSEQLHFCLRGRRRRGDGDRVQDLHGSHADHSRMLSGNHAAYQL